MVDSAPGPEHGRVADPGAAEAGLWVWRAGPGVVLGDGPGSCDIAAGPGVLPFEGR